MKIVNKSLSGMEFGKISKGTAFMFEDDYYMKTSETYDSNDDAIYNAVHLIDGTFEFFMDAMSVSVIDCELVVK